MPRGNAGAGADRNVLLASGADTHVVTDAHLVTAAGADTYLTPTPSWSPTFTRTGTMTARD